MRNAEEGIKNLAEKVDAIVTIPNDLLLKIADKKVTIKDSFKLADDVLRQGVQGIIEVITQRGIMNCDFADVRTIMKDSGVAHMGIGVGKGEMPLRTQFVRLLKVRFLKQALRVLKTYFLISQAEVNSHLLIWAKYQALFVTL